MAPEHCRSDGRLRVHMFDAKAERDHIRKECDDAICAVLDAGRYILGPPVKELEKRLSEYVHAPGYPPVRCVTVANGTDALQLSLLALNIGPGDDVVTVPFTWISSAEVIPLVGANPIFADVDPNTYCLDLSSLERVMTARTRAVIVVSLFGYIPDFTAIRETVATMERKHGQRIAIIEDAAQSFGSRRGEFASCSSPHATLSTTSFFPSKPLGCYGDGGAIFTRCEDLAEAVQSLRQHGKSRISGLHERIGLNSRLDTIQAAILLVKLTHFPTMIERRLARALEYTRVFATDKRIITPTAPSDMLHVYGVYTIRIRQRDDVAEHMRRNGVATAEYYSVCIHNQPAFRNICSNAIEGASAEGQTLRNALALTRQVLSLPIHAHLAAQDQNIVINAVQAALDDLGVSEPPFVSPQNLCDTGK